MCGIAGLIDFSRSISAHDLESRSRKMAESIRHRGPDAGDVFVHAPSGLALAHRRLSILDLTENGAQPMHSRDKRFTLVFNGEIYNHRELKSELEQEGGQFFPWRGTSDTETMLAAFSSWGVEQAAKRMRGMFAFALWDSSSRTLTLGRDRMGEKPLYYCRTGSLFLFGSEIKPLHTIPEFSGSLDMGALAQYMRFQYVPAPRTIFQDVSKLRPGHLLQIKLDDPERMQEVPYWTLKDAVNRSLYAHFEGSEQDAADMLETLLRQTVRDQMISDVPLGSLLSGGIDSSLVTALMQLESDRPVNTFTIGYDDPLYDEARHARQVAQHLGSEHTELTATPDQVLDIIPALPRMYDEPFADASMLPTHLVAKLTREFVTVCLSGDGGDETFGGYNRHVFAPKVWNRCMSMHPKLRNALSAAMLAFSPATYNTLFKLLGPVLPGSMRHTLPGYKVHRLAEAMQAPSRENLYKRLVSTWNDPASALTNAQEPPSTVDMPSAWPGTTDFAQWMQFIDSTTYLPGDILTKVDRATMAVSLESRAPYLDHKVMEFAWRLPQDMKIRNGQGKHILRRILYKHVPRELVDRPKAGFGVPLDSWLRGPLKSWAQDLLSPNRLAKQGLFRPEILGRQWADHMSGRRDNQYRLWNVLMFQSWWDEWMS